MIHWLKSLFRKKRNAELVTFYDVETKTTSYIPRSELAPGVVIVRRQDTNERVYMEAAKLKSRPPNHPPFEGAEKVAIEALAKLLADVYPMSYAKWEEGFRCDENPTREIDLWMHVAGVLTAITNEFQLTAEQRRDCFRILAACFTGERETALYRAKPTQLPEAIVQKTIMYYYDGGFETSTRL